jgi:pSer/pThr/pTyr-binding forkhead associated (FHA) protein
VKALLRILSGDDRNAVIDLADGTFQIGRDEDAEIKINSRQVSRKHARIVLVGEEARIVDNESANGTLVNGEAVKHAVLHDGDRIQIGEVVFEFHVKAARAAVSIPKNDREARTVRRATQPIQVGEGPEPARIRLPSGLNLTMVPVLTVVLSVVFGAIAYVAGTTYKSVLRSRLEKEAMRHASILVRNLAERNREDLRLGNELLLDVDAVLREKGVREATIVNAKGRIVAPVSKLAQLDNDPFTIEALAQPSDREIAPGPRLPDGTHVFVHPIRAYHDKTGAYVTLGAAKLVFAPADAVGSLGELNRLVALMMLGSVLAAAVVSWLVARFLRSLDRGAT